MHNKKLIHEKMNPCLNPSAKNIQDNYSEKRLVLELCSPYIHIIIWAPLTVSWLGIAGRDHSQPLHPTKMLKAKHSLILSPQLKALLVFAPCTFCACLCCTRFTTGIYFINKKWNTQLEVFCLWHKPYIPRHVFQLSLTVPAGLVKDINSFYKHCFNPLRNILSSLALLYCSNFCTAKIVKPFLAGVAQMGKKYLWPMRAQNCSIKQCKAYVKKKKKSVLWGFICLRIDKKW